MPWTKPNNDFCVVVKSLNSQPFAVFRVYKHYVVDEVDHHRMTQYVISREEAAEGSEFFTDTTDNDKLTWRVFTRDRVLLMDWSTDTAGDNLTDGNVVCTGLDGTWGINSEPAGTKYDALKDAIEQFNNWIQYQPD